MTIVEKADLFASVAHGAIGQKRKYSHDDYIVHPRRVAKTVTDIGGTDDMIAAALLHDVIEDTAITGPMIMEAFGASIFKLVVELTDVSKPEDGNRKVRKNIDATRLSFASRDAQIIKLADLIDNSNDIEANDPNFSKVFLKEKAHLLDVMDKVHDHELQSIARANIGGK
jgi:(p)ppGpp synthase/HD superfamily hydrolase|tara:strand:- start:1304 stop:1813 length:510 start_codon:yes stop_codon:yes gene_type:complete